MFMWELVLVFVEMLYQPSGHGGPVVTHLPPTSKVGSSNPGPFGGKSVVAYQWSAVYITEP